MMLFPLLKPCKKKDRDLPKSSYRHVTTRMYTSNASKYVHTKSTKHRLYPFFEGNKDYGNQNVDRSRYTKTKYLCDGKTHKAINEKFFKQLKAV